MPKKEGMRCLPYTCEEGACQDWTPFENLEHRPDWWARYCRGEAVPSPDVPGDHQPLEIKWKIALDRFIPDHYARSTIPLRVEDIYAVLGGNARRRMAALRICRFLRDATCNPVYAACRRRLEAEPMDMTT